MNSAAKHKSDLQTPHQLPASIGIRVWSWEASIDVIYMGQKLASIPPGQSYGCWSRQGDTLTVVVSGCADQEHLWHVTGHKYQHLFVESSTGRSIISALVGNDAAYKTANIDKLVSILKHESTEVSVCCKFCACRIARRPMILC